MIIINDGSERIIKKMVLYIKEKIERKVGKKATKNIGHKRSLTNVPLRWPVANGDPWILSEILAPCLVVLCSNFVVII